EVVRRRGFRSGVPVASQREGVVETEGAHLAQRLPYRDAIAVHAGQMDIGLHPTGAYGGTDAQRILAALAIGIARDAAGDDLGDGGEFRPDLEHLRLALRAGDDDLDDDRERPGR